MKFKYVIPVLLLPIISSCKETIIHATDEENANQIVAVLQSQHIDAAKQNSTEGKTNEFSVIVNSDQLSRAWRILKDHGLPKPKRSGLADMFDDPGVVPSATFETARLTRALMGEVAQTLERIDGVQEARVHLVLPKSDKFTSLTSDDEARRKVAKASVLIKANKDIAIKESSIKQLVAGGLAELDADRVAVVISRTAQNRVKPDSNSKEYLVAIGPFWVSQNSKWAILISFSAFLTTIVLLVFAVQYYRTQIKRIRSQMNRHGSSFAPDSSMSLIQHAVGSAMHSRNKIPK